MIKEEKIYNYIYKRQKPFTTDQLLRSLKIEKKKSNINRVESILNSIDDIVYYNKKYYPKITFLPEFKIRIQITEFELSNNMLILGHRILPFCLSELSIDDIALFYKDSHIQKHVKTFNLKDIYMYLSLLDAYRMPILNNLTNEDKNAELNVYDLKTFFEENNFKLSDFIILETKDFKNGMFAIHYESVNKYNDNIFVLKRNDNLFLKTMRDLLKERMILANTEKQLLYTYFNIFNSTLDIEGTMPGSALAPLIIKAGDIAFSTLQNGTTVFHFKGQDPDELDIYPDFREVNMSPDEHDFDLTTSDGILRYTGNSNTEAVLRALIYHLTAASEYSIENVHEYIFKNLNNPLSEELMEHFNRNVNEIHDEIKNKLKKHKPLPEETLLRKRILDFSLEISLFVRELDSTFVDIKALPKNDMYKLVELQNMLESTLPLMEGARKKEKDGLSSMLNSVNQLEDVIKSIIKDIKNKIYNN